MQMQPLHVSWTHGKLATYRIDWEIFTVKIFSPIAQGARIKHAKIFQWLAISVLTDAYVCEYRIKVVSYTGFHLKCLIATSSQVKLVVSSNTHCTVLKLHMHELVVLIIHCQNIFATLRGSENKTHKNLKHENFTTQKFPDLRYFIYTWTCTCIRYSAIEQGGS